MSMSHGHTMARKYIDNYKKITKAFAPDSIEFNNEKLHVR